MNPFTTTYISGKQRYRKILWVAGALVLASVIFAASCVVIGIKYDISPYYVCRKLARHTALSLVKYAICIYDPAEVAKPSFGPELSEGRINFSGYTRLETYFDAPEMQKIYTINHIGICHGRPKRHFQKQHPDKYNHPSGFSVIDFFSDL